MLFIKFLSHLSLFRQKGYSPMHTKQQKQYVESPKTTLNKQCNSNRCKNDMDKKKSARIRELYFSVSEAA